MRICLYPISDIAEDFSLLPFGDGERVRLATIRNIKRQRESLSALLALRELTGDSVPRIERTPEGKPYFADPSFPHFSLCHGGTWAAAVLGDGESGRVGIDLEPLRPYPSASRIAERFFTPKELLAFSEAGKTEEAFFRIWTKKEACAKLTGSGLLGDTDRSVYSRSFLLRAPSCTLALSVCAEGKFSELSWHSPSDQFQKFYVEEIEEIIKR